MSDPIENLRQWIESANKIIVFTGAGISTESGISDYRSKGGLWQKFQPVTIQEFMASEDKRRQYWEYKFHFMEQLMQAKPNKAHLAIDQLEKMRKLKGVITQNIDGLHQLAGVSNEKVLEIHGTNRETICLSCEDIRPWEEVHERLKAGESVPLCKVCKGLIKPNTISFGQMLVPEVLATSQGWSKECDLMLALGSTLIVEPAASLPLIAKQSGAKLVIITLSETPLDRFADLKFESSVSEILAQVI